MINYKVIKVGDLLKFVDSPLYKSSSNLAITKQRAISQYHNPKANKNDVALILAIKNNKNIVGFIGALPDYLNLKNKPKFAWNSCWWIDKQEGKQTAIPLFLQFLKHYKSQVVFRDMTNKTAQIISKFKDFTPVKELNGTRFFLRFSLENWLLKKNKLFKIIKPILHLTEYCINTIYALFFFNKKQTFETTLINQFDDECKAFINTLNSKEIFKRNITDLNWIINYPWVLKSDKKNETNQFYYFSDEALIFKNEIIKLYEHKKLIAVVFLNNHNDLLKVPYLYYNFNKISLVSNFIINYCQSHKIVSFLTYNTDIINYLKENKNPFWYKKKDYKKVVTHKNLAASLKKDVKFQDGEGDFVFT